MQRKVNVVEDLDGNKIVFMEENSMIKIMVNKIRCKKCGDVIESRSVHDFKFCKCESVAVDGGHNYLRRLGEPENWEDLSEYEMIEDETTILQKPNTKCRKNK